MLSSNAARDQQARYQAATALAVPVRPRGAGPGPAGASPGGTGLAEPIAAQTST